jgi:hypothetical protein
MVKMLVHAHLVIRLLVKRVSMTKLYVYSINRMLT